MTRLQTQSPFGSPLIRQDSAMQVRVKDEWDDAWKTVPFLDPVSSEMHAGPQIGQAQLRRFYGRIAFPGQNYAIYEPVDLAGKFVQIRTVSNSATRAGKLWHGVVTSEQFAVDGADSSPSGSGVQIITAMELGHILNRKTLRGAIFEDSVASQALLGVMPTFNRRATYGLGQGIIGNRSAAKFPVPAAATGAIDETYIFGGEDIWTHEDILEYILGRHAPEGLGFKLAGQFEVLSEIEQVHAYDGQDLWSSINLLIERRRGLGFHLDTDGEGVIDLRVFTALETAISVGDTTIPANPDIIDEIILDDDRGESATVVRSSDGQFDEILVEGALMKTCLSVSTTGQTPANLQPAWSSSQETAYKAAISPTAAGSENDKARKTDEFKRVYQMFRFPRDWNGLGDAAIGGSVALPSITQNGVIDVSTIAKFFPYYKSLGRSLPILKPAGATGSEPEYLEPFAVVIDPETTASNEGLSSAGLSNTIILNDDASDDDDAYNGQRVYLTGGTGVGQSRLIIDYEGSGGGSPRTATVSPAWDTVPGTDTTYKVAPIRYIPSDSAQPMSLRLTDGELGLILQPPINHILGRGHFEDTAVQSNVDPLYDYNDLIFTVALDTDVRARVVARGKTSNARPRSLKISINDAEMWYIAVGTVIGLSNGALVRSPGGLLRDDSSRLRQVAALAKAWYGEQRSTLNLGWSRITNPGAIGSLVRTVSTSYDRHIAGTVITSVKHVYAINAQETRISTSFAEMNFPTASRETTAIQGAFNRLSQQVGNLPVRFPSGAGESGGTTENVVVWNEDSQESS